MALLAFLGRLFTSESMPISIGCLSLALLQFVWGVLAAAIAAGATYFSQAGYAGEFGPWSQRIGFGGHMVAVMGVFAAYVFFCSRSMASALRNELWLIILSNSFGYAGPIGDLIRDVISD